jgi:hypothetical protein
MIIHNDIDAFDRLGVTDYRYLKAIALSRKIGADGCSRYEMDIVLSKVSANEARDLHVRFLNAVGIKIGDIESMFGMQISIVDAGRDQWEGVSFRVSEEENSTFSFACSDFFVEPA